MFLSATTLFALLTLLGTSSAAPTKRSCSYTINSSSDISAAVSSKCTTINVNAFTMPSGQTFNLDNLQSGTTVNINGEVTFASGTDWEGPLFSLSGSDITLNGNGNTFNGNGQAYWDTEGSNGGVTKPKFMHIDSSGTIENLTILNSPVQAFSIDASGLTITGVTVDNRAGNTLSNGKTLGHNTDCFDVEGTDITIENSTCYNQDDCLAINSGTTINFNNNYCSGGHGISIGSIASNQKVSGVTISGNTVVSSQNGLRIKTDYDATGGSVSGVTYTGNTVSGISTYGVVIEQDYENGQVSLDSADRRSPTGKPTNGIDISNVDFTGTNTVSVNSGADQVYVLCGSGSCTGTWNWSGLKTSGGNPGSISGDPPITGYTLS